MGEKEMYEYWSQTYRVHNLEWSQEKAADILHAWQRKFTQVGVIRAYLSVGRPLIVRLPYDDCTLWIVLSNISLPSFF